MARKNRWLRTGSAVLAASASLLALGSTVAADPPAVGSLPGITFLGESDARTKRPELYFAPEYDRINARRRSFGLQSAEGNARSSLLVGIAMSGGGVRSNAYHMGMLSGLHAEPYQRATLLDRIDYVSSVSGGTWANVAFWAWPGNIDDLFACLDAAALSGKDDAVRARGECADAVAMLRTRQTIPLFSRPGKQRKQAWQDDIVAAHLRAGCNVHFSSGLPKECATNLVRKPYIILNSTHSARSESPGADGFPFESTPDGLGTVVDEGSGTPGASPVAGGNRIGFFIRFGQSDATWQKRRFFAARTPGGDAGLNDGSQLSLMAAHSSAVIKGKGVPAAFLSYYFQVSEGGSRVSDPRLRRKYKLTDGGKSDNTGIIPLVDRGADVIVASYMGKESDPKSPYRDLENAQTQAKKLFGCSVSGISKERESMRVNPSSYSCPNSRDTSSRPLLHVHPWAGNIDDFLAHLEGMASAGDTGAAELLRYLEQESESVDSFNRFPQTPTFKPEYDEALIRAYYLLGKFVAQTDVAPFLRMKLALEESTQGGGSAPNTPKDKRR